MGDSGSMLLGLLLAVDDDHPDRPVDPNARRRRDLAPGAAAARCCRSRSWRVPFARPAARRSCGAPAAGRSPFAPDKQHLHHRLLSSATPTPARC